MLLWGGEKPPQLSWEDGDTSQEVCLHKSWCKFPNAVTTKIIRNNPQTWLVPPLCHLLPLSGTIRAHSLLVLLPFSLPAQQEKGAQLPCTSDAQLQTLQRHLWKSFSSSHALFTGPNPRAGNTCWGREQELRCLPAISRKQMIPQRLLPTPTSLHSPQLGCGWGRISS